jgi:hypothetical protein
MTRLQSRRSSRERESPEVTGDDPQMDEWFSRRLESQGIPTRFGRQPTARVLAVAGLAVALIGLIWAFSVAGSADNTSSAEPAASTPPATSEPTPSTGQSGDGDGGKKNTPTAPLWNTIPIDVLNGFGGAGAAGATAATLSAQGWQVHSTADAGTSTTATVVIYAPGHKPEAKVVANRLGLGAPVPESQATGVPAGSTTGVAVLLGPDQLTV